MSSTQKLYDGYLSSGSQHMQSLILVELVAQRLLSVSVQQLQLTPSHAPTQRILLDCCKVLTL